MAKEPFQIRMGWKIFIFWVSSGKEEMGFAATGKKGIDETELEMENKSRSKNI